MTLFWLRRHGGCSGGRQGVPGDPAALPGHVGELAGSPHEAGVSVRAVSSCMPLHPCCEPCVATQRATTCHVLISGHYGTESTLHAVAATSPECCNVNVLQRLQGAAAG